MSITQWFNSIVPQKEDAAWNFRAKVFMAFALSLSLVGSVYNLVYFRVGNAFGGTAIALEAAFLIVMARYFHKTSNLEQAASWSIMGYCAMMFTILISSGGPTFSASPWWVVAPVFITLVNGLEDGKKYFYLSLAVLIGTYIADFFIDFPDFVTKTEEQLAADPNVMGWIVFLDWFHFVGVVLYIGLMAFMFAFINGQAMTEAHGSLEKAEIAKATAHSQKEYLEASVERILNEMRLLAKGDLTTRLEVSKDDAIGRLCGGYNEAVEQIQSALSEILSTVDETAGSSNMIAKSTTQLANGTESQINEMNEITVAVSSMVASITQNADSATNSSEAARSNGRIAREGGMVVQETVMKIDEIANVVDQSSKSIQQLAVSSKEIGEIVGVIQDIASKTNLLALNASIEAAHAGDAGRGFGVIADEVKDLANQTAQATDKITQMIQNIQNETAGVIEDMSSGLAQVDEGKVLASQAGESLNEIVSSSENLIVLVEQIALACEEQSNQSQDFMNRIESMKQVTDTSGQEIQGIAGETVHMEELAERVAQRLAAFKVAEA